MADQGQEQNRTEEATPFKLRRAREKGTVARGLDLGFFGGLVALAAFLLIAGEAVLFRLAQLMRRSIGAGMDSAADPQQATAMLAAAYWPAAQSVLLLGGTVAALVLFLEIMQLRGLVFSTHPLKPDFSRLNPAKGLKRLLSLRMVKEALKNVLKLAAYVAVTALVLWGALAEPGRAGADAQGLAGAMQAAGIRLLLLFVALALLFAAIDQIMVRREFARQMRMSRRELTREAKEREGEPRLKQKRRQFHAELVRQAEGLGKLSGSDLLIVNPHHVAVALAYDPREMAAPTVIAKARNHHALALRREAFRRGIPVFENRPLARELYRDCQQGAEIGAAHYRAVANLYFKLRPTPNGLKNDHAETDIPTE